MTDYILGVPGEGDEWMRYLHYDIQSQTIRLREPGETAHDVDIDTLYTTRLFGQEWNVHVLIDTEYCFIIRKVEWDPPLSLLVGCRCIFPMRTLGYNNNNYLIVKQTADDYNDNTLFTASDEMRTKPDAEKKTFFTKIVRNIMHTCLQLFERRIGFVDVSMSGTKKDATMIMNVEDLVAIDINNEEFIVTPAFPYSDRLRFLSTRATRLIQSLYACIYLATKLAVKLFGTDRMQGVFNHDVCNWDELYITENHPLFVFYREYFVMFETYCDGLYIKAMGFLKSIGNDATVMPIDEESNATHTEAVLRHWLEFVADN